MSDDGCTCPECEAEELAFVTGRQAQYKLMRAWNCYWGAHHPRDERVCVHENTPGRCPTDYRECPLTKDGEK